ncbi:hypothetical protein ACET3Z_012109 [Daucus carota]
MKGVYMDVCLALGILVSELNEEPWSGKLITFNTNLELQKFEDLESYVVLYMIAGTGIGDSCTLDDDNWNMIADNWNWEVLYDDNWNMRAAASVIMICMALVDLRFFKNYKTVEGASTGS